MTKVIPAPRGPSVVTETTEIDKGREVFDRVNFGLHYAHDGCGN